MAGFCGGHACAAPPMASFAPHAAFPAPHNGRGGERLGAWSPGHQGVALSQFGAPPQDDPQQQQRWPTTHAARPGAYGHAPQGWSQQSASHGRGGIGPDFYGQASQGPGFPPSLAMEPQAAPVQAAPVQGPSCHCGAPSVQQTVRKDGPNKDRQYFTCVDRKCQYFQWADEEPRPVRQGPPCYCGTPSRQNTVRKEGSANKDREFFCCAGRQCKYFQWCDEEARPAVRGPPCSCGIPGVERTVVKEGSAHRNRKYFKCAKGVCNHFHWADEEPRPDGDGPECAVCGAPTSQRTAQKDGPNKGRPYFLCMKTACDHFQWADEPVLQGPPCSLCCSATAQRTAQKDGPCKGKLFVKCMQKTCGFFSWADEPVVFGNPCSCGLPSLQQITRKEGPNKNRVYFGCARRTCRFFEWADAPPGPAMASVPTPLRNTFAPHSLAAPGGTPAPWQRPASQAEANRFGPATQQRFGNGPPEFRQGPY